MCTNLGRMQQWIVALEGNIGRREITQRENVQDLEDKQAISKQWQGPVASYPMLTCVEL